MAEITAAKVNELRKLTGLGLMECKGLLTKAEGDLERALTLAKEQGLKHAEKRAGRAAKAGRVEVALGGSDRGAMVELNSETDFVARNEEFRQMAKALAEHVLALGSSELSAVLESKWDGKTVREALTELNARTGENVGLARVVQFAGEGQVDYYIHHDGMKGALVQMSGPCDPGLVKDLAMHIVATPIKPLAVRREEMPEAVVAEQKRIFLTQIATQMADKPEPVREKIAGGKMDAWYKETVLLEQEFVKDPSKRIREVLAAAGKDLTVSRFARFFVGESGEGGTAG
ncbi:MAG: elongation factor Ts [Isosphaeraceae bacterium]|jgi:elongation factor Ts|nr:MAG: elongation factor Ts [Isosphaeraceae bacterium]